MKEKRRKAASRMGWLPGLGPDFVEKNFIGKLVITMESTR